MGNALIKQAGAGKTKIKFKNYGGPTLEKREVENLSQARNGTAATSNGNYALFGGGGGPFPFSKVDAYNVSLVRTTPANLTESKTSLAAAKVGGYGLFAGGGDNFNNPYSSVDAYSSSLAHTTTTSLSEGRTQLAGATAGDYLVFAGGREAGGLSSDKVDAYDNNLAQSTATALSLDRASLVATTVGKHAIFASGVKWAGSGGSGVRNVDAYSDSLVHSTPADVTYYGYDAATAVGDYALFGASSGAIVDVYNSSLVKLTPVNLSDDKYKFAATTVGDYSLFAGGNLPGVSVDAGGNSLLGTYSSDKVDVYDDNLAQTTATALSLDRASLVATTVGDHAIFVSGTKWTGSGGNGVRNVDAYSDSLVHSTPADVTRYGYDAATAVGDYALFGASSGAIVDVYNSSLVKLTPVNLSDDKYEFAATTVGNFALFGGGRNSNGEFSKVEGFDNNLVLHQFKDLSEGKSGLASTTLSKYALFGGGYSSATVECYEYVEKDLELTLLKGAKYKFQNMSNEITVTEDFSTISIPAPATGYVKFKNTIIS